MVADGSGVSMSDSMSTDTDTLNDILETLAEEYDRPVAIGAVSWRNQRWMVMYVDQEGRLALRPNLLRRQARQLLQLTASSILRERWNPATKRFEPIVDPTRAKLPRKRPAMPVDLRFRVLSRDGYACRYCGRRAPDVILHVDHVIPYSKGGTTTEDNLVSACQDCNLGKRDTEPAG